MAPRRWKRFKGNAAARVPVFGAKLSAFSHGIFARIVIGRFVGCYRRNLSRTMLCNVSAAVPVPIYPIAQEQAAFIAHGNRAASGWSDMWWTVLKEAATNWSSHKDARHERP
jgi:hypothetical protein